MLRADRYVAGMTYIKPSILEIDGLKRCSEETNKCRHNLKVNIIGKISLFWD